MTERILWRPPPAPLEGFVRNRDEKIKDMVESILPSKRRKGARFERTRAHRRERALMRVSLLRVTRLVDPDDFGDDLGYEDKEAIVRLVESRREADKVAPLERWAERLIAKDPGWSGPDACSSASTTKTTSSPRSAVRDEAQVVLAFAREINR